MSLYPGSTRSVQGSVAQIARIPRGDHDRVCYIDTTTLISPGLHCALCMLEAILRVKSVSSARETACIQAGIGSLTMFSRHSRKSVDRIDSAPWERKALSLYAIRSLLHIIVFLGLCSFLAWIFVWLDPDYDKYTGKFGAGDWNFFYKSGSDAGTIVLYGYDIVLMLYQWCGILSAIFAVALLNALPKLNSRNGNIESLYELRLRVSSSSILSVCKMSCIVL